VPDQPTGGLGWNDTALPSPVPREYRPAVTGLRRALKDWEPPAPVRTAHADVIAWELGPVTCGVCGQPFR
jgi:hypothetical protein